MDEKAVVSVKKAKAFGKKQNQEYIEERLVKCKIPIYERIKLNKLSLNCEKKYSMLNKGKDEWSVTDTREKPLHFNVCGMSDVWL